MSPISALHFADVKPSLSSRANRGPRRARCWLVGVGERGTCFFLFLLFFVLLSSPLHAQGPTTGTPPFGSFGGGPDIINLANLNSHLTIPVFHKPGRSLPFNFSLVYESSIWRIVGYTGNYSWQPHSQWGWGTGGTDIGRMTYTVATRTCFVAGKPVNGNYTTWSNWVYYDGSGTSHPFYSTALGQTAECSGGGQTGGFSEQARDGSGYKIIVTGDCCDDAIDSVQVISPDGSQINPFGSPAPAGAIPGSIQDSNGNEITADMSGHLTDTLGAVVMTTSGASPNPVTYTYPAPGGTSAAVTVTYKSYTVQTNFGCGGIAEYGPTATSLADRITLPNGTFYQFAYEPTPGSTTNVTGRPASVTLPTGGIISYVYNGGNNGIECSDGTTAGLTRTSPDGTWAYSRVLGTYPASTTTITDPLGNQTVMQFVQIYQTASNAYQGSVATGSLLETVSTCYDGITTNCTTASFGLPISQRVVTTQWANGSQRKNSYFYDTSTTLLTEEDDYDYGSGAPGPLLKKILYAYGYWSDGTNSRLQTITIQNGSGTQVAQTTYNYDETTPVATSGLPQHVPVYVSRRNLTSRSQWLNTTGAQITSHATYFDTGMVNTSTDPNNHSTTYSYSTTFEAAYATTVTNALDQSITNDFDGNTGLLLSTTDANSQTTSFTYDNMLRPSQVNYPNGGQATTTRQESSFPFSVTTTKRVTSSLNTVTKIVLDGSGRVSQTQLNSDPQGIVYLDTAYDSLGRTYSLSNAYRTKTESTYGVTTSFYDALGRTCLVVPPDGTLPTGNSCPATQPPNDVFTTYSGNTTTVADQAGKSRKSVTDGLGCLTQVFEDPAGQNFETDYAYDALDNLLNVNQKGGSTTSANWRTRTFTYDSLSRLTMATNPESGAITYAYNPNGNLSTKTAPAPNQTGSATVTLSYCYDALDRLLTKAATLSPATPSTCSNGTLPSPIATYSYDQTSFNGLTITNGIGRRTGMTDAAGSEAWSYDAMGRPLFEKRTTNGVPKQSTYTYNLDGSIATLTYPSGRVITYTPQSSGANTAGRMLSAVDSANSINYATAAAYAPTGALASLTNGAGVISTFFYNSRLQPCRISVKSSGLAPTSCSDPATSNILDFSYNFSVGTADNGNVTAITNNRDTTRSQNFAYDSLNRLFTAQTTSTHATSPAHCWGEQFGYDPWGNLLNITASSTAYTGCTQEAPSNTVNTKNQLVGYCYDAAGNLTLNATCPTGTFTPAYTYDAENRLTATAGMTYVYDGDGKRVEKAANGTPTKIYWYGTSSDALDETDAVGNTNNSAFNEYIFFNGQRIARRDSANNVDYYFSDHLGTARVVTNSAGAILDDSDFYPFGGERPNSPPTSGNTYKFTGKERDSESGLDNFGKRYFGSSIGRFQTPDPVTISWRRMVNPQLWNAYSYVGNNPLSFVDPTGEELVRLGQHTNDEIKKRKKEIGEELKNKDLTKEQKDALKKERNTLNLEQQGNQVVGNLLAKLDQTGQRNGLQLSDFTLTTDTKNDFAAGHPTAGGLQKMLDAQAFVLNGTQFAGTIYIRTEPEEGFYQMSQRNSDFGYYGGSALRHEQVHRGGGDEYDAFRTQDSVFHTFKNFFQNQDLYRGLDETIEKGIRDNQPH